MKIALQFIVEIVFDNCQENDTIDNEAKAIYEYINTQLNLARMTGEASTWRPKGVIITDLNVQYFDADAEAFKQRHSNY